MFSFHEKFDKTRKFTLQKIPPVIQQCELTLKWIPGEKNLGERPSGATLAVTNGAQTFCLNTVYLMRRLKMTNKPSDLQLNNYILLFQSALF